MPWTDKKPVFKNMERYTDLQPAATTHNGSIYIVWQDRARSALYWARSEPARADHGEFFEIFPVRIVADEGDNNIRAATSPALIESENGVLHLFVAEADNGGALSHFQFDDLTKLWTKRVGVGITAQSAPAVTAINGRVYCVARKASTQDNDELYMSVWDDRGGWSKARVVTYTDTKGGQPLKPLASAKSTFVQLGDQFHLIFPSNLALVQLSLDPDARTWTRVPDSPALLKEVPTSGLGSAAQPNLTYGFVGYGWRGFGTDFPIVSVSQYNTTTWQVREGLNATTKSSPVLVIILGYLYCFWVDPTDNQIMRSRRAVDVGTDDWMSRIADNTPIYALSIPGTHDSAATKEFQTVLQNTKPWLQKPVPWVETQRMTIAQQLYHGIRFLDLRLHMSGEQLIMVHGLIGVNITFASVMADITAFLGTNKSEVLIVSVKNDGGAPDAPFQAALRTVIATNPALWYEGTTLPNLGQCRGQLILLRRFPLDAPINGLGGQPIGFDLNGQGNWPNNTDNKRTPIGPNTVVTIQDNYNFNISSSLNDSLNAKWASIEKILQLSQSTPITDKNLILNFLSATGVPLFGAIDFATGGFYMPEDAKFTHVEGMNQRMWNWLRLNWKKGALKRLGVVVLDYPETPAPDLVNAIINTNKFK